MDKFLVAKYLSTLKEKTGLTYEAIAEKSNRSESTVKNLCSGKAEDPRLDTVAPVIYALGGSMDEMLNPGTSKDELKKVSVFQLREMYEAQIETMKDTCEAHLSNIRSHYEQHHKDLKENYEKRLADKREIIESKDEHIRSLQKDCRHTKILSWICVSILVGILVLEVMNPSLGWVRF